MCIIRGTETTPHLLEFHNPLRLANHLAGNSWPEDFLILTGSPSQDGCDTGFYYHMRVAILDTVLIENVSTQPLAIDNIFGGRTNESRLRVATSQVGLSKDTDVLGISIGTLAPGEKVLLPLRIVFGPNELVTNIFAYRQTSSQIYRRKGPNGFSGNIAGYGAPNFKSYTYGPQIAISGFVINGNRVDLAKRSPNFIELTMRSEAGSCPYLLSHDLKSSVWIDHGKILHKAPDREQQYSEVKVFSGFKGRFRIEEREPELAFIDQVELVILLRNGETVQLQPTDATIAALDGDYLHLLWGDLVEIEFVLPDGIAEEDVEKSRLTVTGYYLRDSSLMARSAASGTADLNDRSDRTLGPRISAGR